LQRQDMADLLKNVLEYLKVNKPVTKDNVAFRIVTVGSFGIFMLCSILNGLTSYFGDPIICKDRDSLMEAECWMHGSYDLDNEHIWNTNCGFPNKSKSITDDDEEQPEVPPISYYQWVVSTLVLSAILFRLPAWIWSMLEGGLMANFYNSNQNIDVLRANEDDLNHLVKKEVRVFRRLQGRWTTKTYYLKFLACQCLALVVLYLTFHGTDQFLDEKFSDYGPAAVKYLRLNEASKKKNTNPICNTFPTRVACNVITSGTAKGANVVNQYCILTQNIINEKIYLALWFWFAAMGAIMTAQLIWEVCFLTLPLVDRIMKLALPSSSGISKYFRQFLIGQVTTGTTSLTRNMVTYLQNLSFGDVFVLYQLGKNTHPDFLYEMLKELSVNEKETEASETEPIDFGRPLLPREENGVEMNSVVTSN